MTGEPILAGLRVDVDTFRGTRDGVPSLVDVLGKHGVRASFFMSVGPDNMGRNLWRLLKPKFLLKMLRSNAANLYGYDILLRGTAWPGPLIGRHFSDIIRMPDKAGHEMGLHAWDHFTWQARIDQMSEATMRDHTKRGMETLAKIIGRMPDCTAAAGWRCTEQALLIKEPYNLRYNSDCRGDEIFTPVVQGKKLTPQIPVTLPTYDEVIGVSDVTNATYNRHILDQIKPGRLNVYTIHSEAEGIALRSMFDEFLSEAAARNIRFVPLGGLLDKAVKPLPQCSMIKQEMPGREGWLAWQGERAAV